MVVALVLAGASAAVVIRLPAQGAASADVTRLLSVAERIPPGSTFLALEYAASGRAGIPTPFAMSPADWRYVWAAGGVDVGHYEAVHPYFQVSFAGGPRPTAEDRSLARWHGADTAVVGLAAARNRLDDVVVLGLDRAPPPVRTAAATRQVLDELSAHYERVVLPGSTGTVALWRAVPGVG